MKIVRRFDRIVKNEVRGLADAENKAERQDSSGLYKA